MKIIQSLLTVVSIASVSAKLRHTGTRRTSGKSGGKKGGMDMGMEDISAFAIASGAQEVPPVNSDTSAQLVLDVSDDLSSIDFLLEVERGVDINQAHLHCAPAGANGAVLAFLSPLNEDGVDVDGTLVEGTLTNDSLLGVECEGVVVSNISTLVEFILQRRIYLNVHSLMNPGGEVRGQVFMA